MFTGLVEETGRLEKIELSNVSRITLKAKKVLEESHLGDSISVNGICLTVIDLDAESVTFEVMKETLARTNLGQLKKGDTVNLERAVGANGRFGGHFVTGHIDGIGRIREVRKTAVEYIISAEAPADILKMVVPKGSIAIDGISLTVINVNKDVFTVGIIPHTLDNTNLANKRAGDSVNLETDLIGKYVFRFQHPEGAGRITEDYLRKMGFDA